MARTPSWRPSRSGSREIDFHYATLPTVHCPSDTKEGPSNASFVMLVARARMLPQLNVLAEVIDGSSGSRGSVNAKMPCEKRRPVNCKVF